MNASAIYKFQLFVARDTQNSAEAISNLTALCRTHLKDRHSIEIIDVTAQPARALAEDIRMTPTLIMLRPLPSQRIVGTLQQTRRVLLALRLDAGAA